MKSRTVKLAASVVVLAVLCGAYVGVKSYVASQEEKETEEADTSVNVVSVDSGDVASVAFRTSDGKEVTLEKDGDSWKVKGEEDFPLNQDTVDSAVGSIAALDADQEISDVEDFSQYDLDDPQKEITLTTSEGDKTVLQVGLENTSSSQYYLKKEGDDDKVYLVANSALDPFMGTEYKFAKSESFPSVTSASITDVKVEKENGYELKQDKDTLEWTVSGEAASGGESANGAADDGTASDGENAAGTTSDGETVDGTTVDGDMTGGTTAIGTVANGENVAASGESVSEQADTTKAGNVTSAIGSLAYGDFVDYNCTDDSKYGFDQPYAVITADYTEEEKVEDDGDSSSEDADTADTDEVETDEADESSDTSEDTASEDSSDEDEAETRTVNKQIVIYIGDQTGTSRYVKVNDSKQVYTITSDSLSTILDSTVSDFYSLTVHYLTVDNLDSLQIQDADGSHTVQVTRTTKKAEDSDENGESEDTGDSKDTEDEESNDAGSDETEDAESSELKDSEDSSTDDTEEEETVSYTLDGKELDESSFTTFYNKLINLTAQERLTDPYTPDGDAAYTFIFKDTDGKETTVSCYEYDTSFYAAVVDNKVYLVNKMNIRDLADAYQEMLDSEEDAEETEEASKETSEKTSEETSEESSDKTSEKTSEETSAESSEIEETSK